MSQTSQTSQTTQKSQKRVKTESIPSQNQVKRVKRVKQVKPLKRVKNESIPSQNRVIRVKRIKQFKWVKPGKTSIKVVRCQLTGLLASRPRDSLIHETSTRLFVPWGFLVHTILAPWLSLHMTLLLNNTLAGIVPANSLCKDTALRIQSITLFSFFSILENVRRSTWSRLGIENSSV